MNLIKSYALRIVALSAVASVSACGGEVEDAEFQDELTRDRAGDDDDDDDGDLCGGDVNEELVEDVRALISAQGITPLETPPAIRPELVTLGRALFHDKILSGSHDVSCGTCHSPALGLTDRRPLFSSVKGEGVGLDRVGGHTGGRHTQTLFNLHVLETLAIDGKVEQAGDTVLGLGLPVILPPYQAAFEDFPGVTSPRVIAAQALVPEVTFGEMLGMPGDDPNNEIIGQCLNPETPLPLLFACMFDAYMARLGAVPEYVDMFEAAYGAPFETLNFGHAGTAIAAYQVTAFSSNNSPWDQFVAGDDCALTDNQLKGARHFLDEERGGCATCHSGNAFTDNEFHQTLAPQFGCGNDLPKRNGADGYDDFGRTRNTFAGPWIFGPTGDEIFPVEDRYRWRTAPLRNIEFTAPYGRLGHFATLEDYVAHYGDPVDALVNYDITQLPDTPLVDYTPFQCEHDSLHDSLLDNADAILTAGIDPALDDVNVKTPAHVHQLVAFLESLSDESKSPAALAQSIPSSVPSGLPVDAP
ncbi:MAG: hypothetical protein KC468_12255 [Myxococcales bacterium]|nr:hypothetical protein [Myxococcales bacterium]